MYDIQILIDTWVVFMDIVYPYICLVDMKCMCTRTQTPAARCQDHISEREQLQVETMKPTLQINVYKQPQAAKKLGKAGQETKGIPIPDPSTNGKEDT